MGVSPSVPVVGAALQDGDGAIDLFGQHQPGERMGPGLGAERQGLVGASQKRRRQAVGAADDDHQLARPVVAQLGDAGGEGARGVGRAVFVAGDHVCAMQMLEQKVALGGLAWLAAFQLHHFDRSQPQGAAGGRRALGVITHQSRFGRATQAPDGEEDDLQLAAALAGGSTDQIFSML